MSTPFPKYKTIAIDTGGDLARLAFSWELKKELGDYENIRAMNDYPGMSERLAMVARRCKDFKKMGMEVVWTFHEDVDKIYTRGSAMAKKGQNNEPTMIKPRVALPGNAAPIEVPKSADNLFRVRLVNGKPAWVCKGESVGPGASELWEVKDRFNAEATLGAYLPISYEEIAKKMKEKGPASWHPPYIWMIYGAIGMKKTLSLASFPRPIRIFDLDDGSVVLGAEIEKDPHSFHITKYNCEDKNEWPRFLVDFESVSGDPNAVAMVKTKLGIK